MNKEFNKEIYHIHDKSYKDLYSKKEIALDLFRSQIKEPWTKEIRLEDLTLVNKSFVTSDYEETECDIVYKAQINDTEVIFYILLEFQSSIDYRMPLRLLFYMCEILRDHSKNANHKKNDKHLKIPAIIPIVLYNGKQVWDVPNEFRKMTYNEKLFGNNILNFKYDIIDINNDYSKEELENSKNVSSAIFLLDQKMDALEFLRRIRVIALFFNELTDVETKAIKHWIRNTMEDRLAESAIDILEADKEEVEAMVANNAFVLKEMREKSKLEGREEGRKLGIEEGRKEGRELGIEEGRKEGLKEGLQQGIEKGKYNKAIENARNFLNLGIDVEIVAQGTGLSLEEVNKIKDELNK